MNQQQIIASLQTELISGRRTQCDPTWGGSGAPRFSDPFSRLYWVQSGRAAVLHDDREIQLKPGNLYVLPAFKPARYVCPDEMDLYWIHFKSQLFGSLDVFELLGWKQVIPVSSSEDVSAVFACFFESLESEEISVGLEADAKLRSILGRFASTGRAGHKCKLTGMQRFLPAITYIEQNLHRHISLADLTRVVPLQHAYFCDLFTRIVGLSPVAFINHKRIERAQFLLLQNDRPLKAIASDLGFSDVYYFSRVFKKLTGIAPAHYRRQQRH